jgi:hypothetical protein
MFEQPILALICLRIFIFWISPIMIDDFTDCLWMISPICREDFTGYDMGPIYFFNLPKTTRKLPKTPIWKSCLLIQ